MTTISFPELARDSETSIEAAIAKRRSRRSFAESPLETSALAALLWAAQGITDEKGGIAFRTAPSAGATHPLKIFLEVPTDGAEDVSGGLYHYEPEDHELTTVVEKPIREALVAAAFNQDVVRDAAATIAIAANYDTTVREYPDHGRRYVHMEAGHAAQNVQLVCESLDLSCCPVGAFADDELHEALSLPTDLDPLYLLPVGNRTDEGR